MDLAFQKVQEVLLLGFSALCALSGKLIVSINARETLTTVMDSVAKLLDKGVIENSNPLEGDFISTIFVRPKKNGSH